MWIKENLTSDFTEFYLSTTDDALQYIDDVKKKSHSRLSPVLQMNVDEEARLLTESIACYSSISHRKVLILL